MAITPPAHEAVQQQLPLNTNKAQSSPAQGQANRDVNAAEGNSRAAVNQEAAVFHQNTQVAERQAPPPPATENNTTPQPRSSAVETVPERAAVEVERAGHNENPAPDVETALRKEALAATVKHDAAPELHEVLSEAPQVEVSAPETNAVTQPPANTAAEAPEEAVEEAEGQGQGQGHEVENIVQNVAQAEVVQPEAPEHATPPVTETAPEPQAAAHPPPNAEAEVVQREQAEGQAKNRPIADKEIGGTVDIAV